MRSTKPPSQTRIDPKADKQKVAKAKAKEQASFAAATAKHLKTAGKDMTAIKAGAAAHKARQQKLQEQQFKLEKALTEIKRQQEEEWKLGIRILRKYEAAHKEMATKTTVKVDGAKPPTPKMSYVARADALLVMIALAITVIAKKLK